MSDLETFLRTGKSARTGAAEAKKANDIGFLGGFVESSISGIGELFGQDATPEAQRFRDENPFSGFVSELVSPFGVYGAAYKVSRLPSMAARLDRGVNAVGDLFRFDMATAPIRSGAVKEILRYAPLELTRLGVGLATAPEDNIGDLFADVGLSTLLAGGFGGIGGFFRAGGVDAPVTGKVLGADLALRPTFEFRLGRAPAAQSSSSEPLEDVLLRLRQEIFTELPQQRAIGGKARYVEMLEGGDGAGDELLNGLFRPSKASAASPGLQKRLLAEGAPDDPRTLDFGEQQELAGALGFGSVDDLAENVVFPREIKVKSTRGAATLGSIFTKANGWAPVQDGLWLGKEANSGLFVMAKKVGAAGPRRKAFGEAVVQNGDRWVVFKTDKPQAFAPELHSVAEGTVARWAKLKEPFQPQGSGDVFNKAMDHLEGIISPVDYTNLPKLGKKKGVALLADRVARKALGEAGLANSTSARMTAEWLWDVVAPTVFKERNNSLYGRLLMQLRTVQRVGEEEVFRFVRGGVGLGGKSPLAAVATKFELSDTWEGGETLRKLWSKLGDDERQLVVMASKTQTPAEDLAALTADGLISKEATEVVKALQAADEYFIREKFLPALTAAGKAEEFQALPGYLLPRIFKGDWHLEVVDEAGRRQWLAVGNLKGVKEEAQAVIDSAAEKGLKWRFKSEPQHEVKVGPNELEAISDYVAKNFSNVPESADIVRAAMRKLMIARGVKKAPGFVGGGKPGTFNTRQGQAGSPDLEELSVEDVLSSLETHYKQLMRFAGYHNWKQRYEKVALQLEKTDKTAFADLQRKANQIMGIDGPLTKQLDAMLQPVLGHWLGNRAATRIAQATNETMYQWNLAILNPTFALLNLLTPLQTVTPWVKYMTSVSREQAAKHMMFVPMAGADGRARGAVGMLHPMKVLKQAMGSLRSPSAELRQMQEQALTDGTLLPQHYDAFAGAQSEGARTLGQAWKEDGMVGFLKKGSNWMADKSEQLSRMTAFNAAYHLGQDFFGLAGDDLYRFTQQGVRATMYGYSVIDRSRMFTGPVGSMFGLFKNWQMHFMGNMMEYAGVALRDGNFGPLAWQMGSALALGGLGATPLKLVADGLAKSYGETPDSFLWLQENWGQDGTADAIYFGLPSFLGASLQASSTIPGTDVRNEAANLFNFVIWERAKAAGKAVGAAWDLAGETGENPLMNDNVRDALIAGFGPRAMFRAMSTTEGDYIRSMGTGYPSVRELGPSTKILHALGLNQVEVDRQQIAGKSLWKQQEAMRSAVVNLGTAYADAQLEGDYDAMQRVVDQTLMQGIPLDSVMKSALTRVRREEEGDSLSRYDKGLAERYINALQQERE